jgi:hypothetical protein
MLSALLALVLGFWSFSPAQAVAVVRWGGYWFMLAATVAFAVVLVRSLRGELAAARPGWRGWWGPVLVALAAAAFLHLHERHEYKIVADEVVLQMTARQMHFFREASVVARGYDVGGTFLPLISYVDKRPLLFPFLLATAHDLTGFRPGNVYVLNAALSGAFMLLVLLIGRRIAGWGAGVTAVLLFATVPLLAQNSCGSGFELLNLTLIVLTIWLGMRAAERVDDDDRLGAFVLSGVLLTQVRYESVLFVLPVAAAVAYLWWRARAVRLPWPVLIAPLLMVMSPLQMNVFRVSEATWQLRDVPGADHPFAFRYFYENVGHALNFFLCTDGTQSNSVLVAVAGAVGVGFFTLLLFREHRALFRDRPGSAIVAIFLLGLVLHALMMMCYFWGRWDDPVIRRLSLPTHVLFVLSLVFVWPRLVPHPRRWAGLAGACLLYLVGMTVPSNAMHRFTQENYAARTVNWLTDEIRALGDDSALIIDGNSGLQWFLHGKSNVTVEAVALRPEALLYHFRNRTFAHYFVVQRVTPVPGTGARSINLRDDVGPGVQLQTVEERAFAPLYLVRLAKIVSIDEPKFRAWAKDRAAHPVVAPPPATGPAATNQGVEHDLEEWFRHLP